MRGWLLVLDGILVLLLEYLERFARHFLSLGRDALELDHVAPCALQVHKRLLVEFINRLLLLGDDSRDIGGARILGCLAIGDLLEHLSGRARGETGRERSHCVSELSFSSERDDTREIALEDPVHGYARTLVEGIPPPPFIRQHVIELLRRCFEPRRGGVTIAYVGGTTGRYAVSYVPTVKGHYSLAVTIGELILPLLRC